MNCQMEYRWKDQNGLDRLDSIDFVTGDAHPEELRAAGERMVRTDLRTVNGTLISATLYKLVLGGKERL